MLLTFRILVWPVRPLCGPGSHCIPWPSLLGPLKLRVGHCRPASGGQLRLSSQRSRATMWVWLGGFCALGRDPTFTATCLCPQPGQCLDTSVSISRGSSLGARAHSPRAASPPCLQTGGREVQWSPGWPGAQLVSRRGRSPPSQWLSRVTALPNWLNAVLLRGHGSFALGRWTWVGCFWLSWLGTVPAFRAWRPGMVTILESNRTVP